MTLREFRLYLADVAWFWPGVAISIVLGVALGARVARVFGVQRSVGAMIVTFFGVIGSATLTPSREALRFGDIGSGVCDLSRVGPASWQDLFGFADPTFNVLLFIPLGVAIGFVPPSRWRALLIVVAIALPFAIETIQLLATTLDRACQSADVSDNLTGLVTGIAVGAMVRLVRERCRRTAHRD